jgi:hypothetical protein
MMTLGLTVCLLGIGICIDIAIEQRRHSRLVRAWFQASSTPAPSPPFACEKKYRRVPSRPTKHIPPAASLSLE